MSEKGRFEAQLEEELLDRLAVRTLPDAYFEVTGLDADLLTASVSRTMASADAAASGALPDDLQLETIVRAFKRPSLLIQGGSFAKVTSETWSTILDTHRTAIERAIPAVGRIEVRNHSSFEWVGTGFLVDVDVLATNRHVAREFARRDGDGFTWRRNHRGKIIRANVDFREEHGLPDEEEFGVQEVLHLEDAEGPDLTLLRILTPSPAISPLKLQGAVATDMHVGAIGYPWRDSRVAPALVETMERIFQGIFDVKRFAPGTMIPIPSDSDLGHDCTTVGGNSGSALIDLASGAAVGLHYGGYSDYNVAVPSAVLIDRLSTV